MASFSECWGQLKAKGYKHANGKEVLTDNDKQSILDRTETFKKEDGLSHDEAIRKSLQEHHDEAHAQVQSIHEQVFGKQEPVVQTGAVVTGEAEVPSFAAKYDPETLLTPPKWAYDKYGKVFEDRLFQAIHNPEKGVDVTGIWKDLTPAERQELVARGFSPLPSRKFGQVILQASADSIPARNYFRMQETLEQRRLAGETSPVSPIMEATTAQPLPQKPIESGTGETPPTEPPTVTPETLAGTGISSERFTEAYGDSAPVANTGKGAGAWKDEGLSRLDNFQKTGDVKDDPYSVLTNLREGRTPVSQYPSDVALLGSEHQRLLEAARNAEGTPEYAEKSQAALNMAEAIKEVAHGPASDVFRSLQEYDKPRYDNVTDFDQALREREKRESTPTEKVAFKKMADDVASTRDTAAREVSAAQAKLGKFPKMGFDDAAKSIRDQFSELTKNCGL